MIDNIENKIGNLHLQEFSLKNRSFWKLVISLEASFFDVTAFIYSIREVLERLPPSQYRYFIFYYVL